jgi:UDP-GlcNAc:undecaprenyl-phosphate GlcNAc-1-phosphate transferase
MFLGFVLAVLSIETSRTSSGAVALLVPIVALAYPIADTLLAMARRAVRGAPLFSADRGHIHHRMLTRGLSQRQTASVIWAVSVVLCWAATFMSSATDLQVLGTLGVLTCGLLVALWRLGYLDWSKLGEISEQRRRNVERRRQVAELANEFRRSADLEAFGASLARIGPVLQIDHVSVSTPGRSWCFTSPGERARHVVRYPLGSFPASREVLEVGWTSVLPDRDSEIAIERLCPHLSAALHRIARQESLHTPARLLGSIEAIAGASRAKRERALPSFARRRPAVSKTSQP